MNDENNIQTLNTRVPLNLKHFKAAEHVCEHHLTSIASTQTVCIIRFQVEPRRIIGMLCGPTLWRLSI